MNALHTHIQHVRPQVRSACHRPARHGVDWAAQIKLAIVLSAVAALTVVALAGRVAEPVLIVGIIVVASAVAWSRIEPPQRLHRQPLRVNTHRH